MGGNAIAITFNYHTACLQMVGGNGDKKLISILGTVILLELRHVVTIRVPTFESSFKKTPPPLFMAVISTIT